MREGNIFRANPSYPQRDMYPIFLDLTMAKGTCVRLVFSAIRVVKDSICPMSSSNLSIFEQPERMRVCNDFNL